MKNHIFFSPGRLEENAESVSKLCDEIFGVVLAGCGLGYLCKGKIESVCDESLQEMEKTALNIASTASQL